MTSAWPAGPAADAEPDTGPSRDASTTGRAVPVLAVVMALALGGLLRGVWLTADPPTHDAVGIVWHDEGAWVHNARNRALWGRWRTDQWNPVYIAPVYTALEYAAFRELGVGTWQARVVPALSGLLAIVALAAGLAAVGGSRSATIGAFLLATNYVFVMWNRTALMESTMTACIVASWAAYARSGWRWGGTAGVLATLAWFTKAAAAFFIAALVLECGAVLALAWSAGLRRRVRVQAPSRRATAAAAAALVGLAASAALIAVLFVVPHWSEYRFYNWQMSVTRKPVYSVRALVDRASWLPLVEGFFARMWLALVGAALATGVILARLRESRPGERLLVLWLLLGLLELVVHDAGNERRYVMLVPALIALAALLIGSARARAMPALHGRVRWLALPLAMFLAYLVAGSLARWVFIPDIVGGQLRGVVRLVAAVAAAGGALVVWRWNRLAGWLSAQRMSTAACGVLVGLVMAGDLGEFARWAAHRTDENYQASLLVGRLLPPETLVHGKLANGLSLENRIRPVFVGRGFGNYADRTTRDDVRYVLTYVGPYVGYEGRVIRDVLAAYPRRAIVATFPVAETASGHDRAALVDKFGAVGSSQPATPRLPPGTQ